MTTPASPTRRDYAPDGCGASGLERADLDHGGQLDQLGLVLVGVVLAEQQFGS